MGQGRRLHFTRAPREDSAQRGITFLLLLIVCHRSLHLDILLFAHFREGNGADPFCPNFNFLTPSFISLHPTPPPSPLPRKPRKPKLQLCQITTNNMKGKKTIMIIILMIKSAIILIIMIIILMVCKAPNRLNIKL